MGRVVIPSIEKGGKTCQEPQNTPALIQVTPHLPPLKYQYPPADWGILVPL